MPSMGKIFLKTPYTKAVLFCNGTSSRVLRYEENRSPVKPLNVIRHKKLKLKILSLKKKEVSLPSNFGIF